MKSMPIVSHFTAYLNRIDCTESTDIWIDMNENYLPPVRRTSKCLTDSRMPSKFCSNST